MSRYRIRNVSQLTGVSTATLRAWERRYGVPSPARTATAYRLYSDEDVALIKRMRALVDTGIAASEAAAVVLAAPATERAAPHGDIDPFALAAARIVDATLRFDPEAVELEVSRALTLGPATIIFDRALSPALEQIGELWHEGSLTVAQEHLVSQVMLGALIDMLRVAQPAGGVRRVALACFADEEHFLNLYGIALHFASWGYRVVMIGARTPPSALARVVSALAPDVVGLSVTIAPTAAQARELIDAYADACNQIAWIVGGAAAPGMRTWIEARGGLVADVQDTRKLLDAALAEKRRRTNSKVGR